MIEIKNIQKTDIEEVLRLAEVIFSSFNLNVIGVLNYKTNWDISLKLTLENKIVGFYLFRFQNISNQYGCKGMKGIEGVALGIDESHRGKGYGDLLIYESYRQFSKSHDYIWGMHYHTLGVEAFWEKRRTIVAYNTSFFISLKMFTYKIDIPQLRQPNTFSCGNTCIKMILNYLNIHTEITIGEIITICGSNKVFGTRDIEMRVGLDYFGIPYQQNKSTGEEKHQMDYLKNVLRKGNVFFLRTLMDGIKHWVIVYGFDGEMYFINDPSQGSKTFTTQRLIEVWKPRAYDGFEIELECEAINKSFKIDTKKTNT